MNAAAASRRVLLVDDDPFFLGVQGEALRRAGWSVETAGNTDRAMAVVARGSPAIDVLVCDLNMPASDGIEFLQQLASTEWAGDVILQSGEGPRILHSVRRLLQDSRLSIVGAVQKPASAADFRRLLEERDQPVPPSSREAPTVTHAELEEATRTDQWCLLYQPKVDMRTGHVRGMEALLRWQHPRHGVLSPDRFIPLAEASGAIEAMTRWVLREALRQATEWMQLGRHWPVAVNLSMRDLEAADFVPRLLELVSASPVSPADLTLEVTESRLMSSSLEPLKALIRLRMQRFSLSIDDFGTGHSSLVQLRDVPFNELKIDRSFVHAARDNDIVRPILEGSIGLARGLGMQCVAEGVETEDDWQLLQELGCDVAQGWFIGHPMAADRLAEWSAAWRGRTARLGVVTADD